MDTTTLGRTGLRVSTVGLGAGGPSRLGQTHGTTQADIERLLQRAIDLGVTFIDTAAGYGTEEAIGTGLANLGASDDIVLATKAGPVRDGQLRSADDLTQSIETSLRSLRRERLDLFQFHGVEPEWHQRVVDELLPVARTWQEQGKVGFVGITENPSTDHEQQMAFRACESGVWDSIMVQYGVFDQVAARTVLPTARRQEMGTICMSAARASLVNEQMLQRTLAQLGSQTPDDLRWLLAGASKQWPDLAFRFAAAQDFDVVLVGTGNADHFEQSARATLAEPLPAEHVAWLREAFGHVDGSILWDEDV